MSVTVGEDIIIVSGYIQTDQIVENTSNNGVLIENVLLKDSNITIGSGISSYTFPPSIGLSGQTMVLNTSGGLVFETLGTTSVLAPSTFGNDNRLIKSSGTLRNVESTGIIVSDSNDISGITTLNASGVITLTNATVANGVTSGALLVTGGVGIGANLDVGTTLEVAGTSELNGAVSMTSTLNVTDASTLGSTLKINSTINSTSSTGNGALIVSGGAIIGKNLIIGGNLIVEGNTTTINSTTTSIIDPMFKLASGNPADTYDFGIYGEYSVGGSSRYSGLHRVGGNSLSTLPEVSGKWILFDSATTEPGPLNVGDPGVSADLVVGQLWSTSLKITPSGGNTTNGSITLDYPTGSNYTLVFPGTQGSASQVLINNGSGTLSWGNPIANPSFSVPVSILNATVANGVTSGALLVTGGVGIGANLDVGTTLEVAGTSELNGAVTMTSTLNVSGTSNFNNNVTVIGDVTATNLKLNSASTDNGTITLAIASDDVIDYILVLPRVQGGANTVLTNDGSGILSWSASGSDPNVVTATNSFGTDNRLTRTVGTGKEIESTGITISDTNGISGVTTFSASGVTSITNATVANGVTSGALLVTGGVGIGANLDVGTTLEVAGTSELNGAVSINSTLNVSGTSDFNNNVTVIGDVTATNLKLNSASTDNGTITLAIASDDVIDYTLVLPIVQGGANTVLTNDGSGILSWSASGSDPNVVTATNSFGTDNRLTRTVGTGKEIESTGITISDTNGISGVTTFSASGVTTLTNATVANGITSGALLVTGGVGIGANLDVGTTLEVAGTSELNGAVSMTSTLNVTGISEFNNNITVIGDVTATNLKLNSISTDNGTITLAIASDDVIDYTLTLPRVQGGNNQILINNGSGVLYWGSASSDPNGVIATNSFGTDNRLTRTVGTGKEIESTGITISDTNGISGVTTFSASGVTSITNATVANGVTSGALLVTGGVGIGANLDVGTTLEVAGTSELNGAVSMTSTLNVSGTSEFNNNVTVIGDVTATNLKLNSASTDNGTITLAIASDDVIDYTLTLPRVQGGVNQILINNGSGVLYWGSASSDPNGVTATNSFGTDNRLTRTVGTGKEIESTGITISDTNGISGVTTFSASGVTSITNATVANGVTSGALLVTGGVGIGANLDVGTTLEVAGTSELNGAVSMTSTLNVSGTSDFNNNVTVIGDVTATNLKLNSISTDNGTITLAIASDDVIDYTLTLPRVQGGNNQILINNGSGVLYWGSASSDPNGVTATNSFGTDNRLTRTVGTGKEIESTGITISDTNGISGVTTFSASGVTSITNATVANGVTSGALLVTGGVGIGANLDVGTTLEVAGTSELNGAVTMTSTLNVSGTSNFNNNVTVIGDVTATNLKLNSASTDNGTITLAIALDDVIDYTLTLPRVQGLANTVLTNNGSGILSWGSKSSTDTTSTVTTSTTSTTYTQIDSMTNTPAAGNYIVLFSSSGKGDATNQQIEYAIHVGGTEQVSSHRFLNYLITNALKDLRITFFTQARVTVNGSQAIDVQYRTNTGTITIYERSLIIIQV